MPSHVFASLKKLQPGDFITFFVFNLSAVSCCTKISIPFVSIQSVVSCFVETYAIRCPILCRLVLCSQNGFFGYHCVNQLSCIQAEMLCLHSCSHSSSDRGEIGGACQFVKQMQSSDRMKTFCRNWRMSSRHPCHKKIYAIDLGCGLSTSYHMLLQKFTMYNLVKTIDFSWLGEIWVTISIGRKWSRRRRGAILNKFSLKMGAFSVIRAMFS